MQLRPRQIEFRDKCVKALKERGNTLGVAPTGAGKTVMMAAIGGALGGTGIVLQHRDELVAQNRRTFFAVNPKVPSDLFTADRKRFARDGVTFAMVQTLVRSPDAIPPVDWLQIDEAHHAAANSYRQIIEAVRKANPDVMLCGVTATPNRGDKKALRGVFDNCADQISLRELIAGGFLVRPRTFVVDIGVADDLRGVKKLSTDFDMAAVEAIMDKDVLNERVVEEWRKLAGERRTVVFCSTINHSNHVCEAFRAAGVRAAVVEGNMTDAQRRDALAAFDRGELQVIINVAILTEGWDCQPVSCVVLLRPSSYKSTMVQMIGRGLRRLDPERYPGHAKDDCVVIDFGTSILLHGAIESTVDLDGKGTKDCPECNAVVPEQSHECPICGYEFPRPVIESEEGEGEGAGGDGPGASKERATLGTFVLTEIDLLNISPYRWEELFGGLVMVATAFDAWAMCVHYYGQWHAVGGTQEDGAKHLSVSADRILSLSAADDFMREHGDESAARKTKSWLSAPPSDKQLSALGLSATQALGMTRYKAGCLLTWKFNERIVRAKLEQFSKLARAA